MAFDFNVAASFSTGPGPTATAHWGPGNAAGTAQYDAGAGAGLTNGVYFSRFTVSGGRYIDVDGAQVPGIFDVSGVQVEVGATAHAVGSSAELASLGAGAAGKTIWFRKGAQADLAGLPNNTDYADAVLRGEGGDPRLDTSAATDAEAHFLGHMSSGWQNITLRELRGTPSGGSMLEFIGSYRNITVERCALQVMHPNPQGGSTDSGILGMVFAETFGQGVRLIDNVIVGGTIGLRIRGDGYNRYADIVGNHFDLTWTDTIQFQGWDQCQAGTYLAANWITRPVQQSSGGGAHGDDVEISGARKFVAEGNMSYRGDAVGSKQGFFFVWSGSNFEAKVRANGFVSEMLNTILINPSGGSRIDYCAWLPSETMPLPLNGGGAEGKFAITGTGEIANCFAGEASGTNNFQTGANYDAANFTAAIPAYPIDNQTFVATYKSLLDAWTPTPGGDADGRTPAAILSIAAGAEASEYTADTTLVPAPVLSGASVTPASTSFSATVQTTVDLDPIWWAVVPSGAAVASVDDIRLRKLSGALDYGSAHVPLNQTATNIALSGTAGALASGVNYDLVLAQKNGWARESAITRVPFLTL